MIKLSIISLFLFSFVGCSAIPGVEGTFENVLSCAVAGDKAYVNSEYGPVSVGTRLRDADTIAICPVPVLRK